MKRRKPLRKRTPLKYRLSHLGKRGRSKPLNHQSTDRKYWNSRYKEQCLRDSAFQRCAATGVHEHRDLLERHHVARRRGQNILIYCYVQPYFHRQIEDNTKWAREKGWLRDYALGYPQRPDQPRPWIVGTCLNEKLLRG